MAEIRLIDANAIDIKENGNSSQRTMWENIRWLIKKQPTIDPETLPIVRELREKLERVTKERDAAIVRIRQSHWCEDCKNNQIMKLCANECDCDFCGEPCYCENCHEGNLWEWRGPDGDHP